jgi:histidine triad (HIT) family protein
MASIFSKIVNREIPAFIVAESDSYLAFLDIQPLALGHVLVIPKVDIDYIFDLNDEEISGLFLFSKKVAKALKATIPCLRVGVAVIGLEVPHAHVHLVPLNSMSDINFMKPKLNIDKQELEGIAMKIKNSYESLT